MGRVSLRAYYNKEHAGREGGIAEAMHTHLKITSVGPNKEDARRTWRLTELRAHVQRIAPGKDDARLGIARISREAQGATTEVRGGLDLRLEHQS